MQSKRYSRDEKFGILKSTFGSTINEVVLAVSSYVSGVKAVGIIGQIRRTFIEKYKIEKNLISVHVILSSDISDKDIIAMREQISQNLNNQFLASGAAGGQRLPSTDPQQGFLASGAAGGASLQVDENKIDRGNPTGDSRIVSEEQGLVGGRVPDAIRTGQPAIGMGVPDAVKFGQPALPDTKITNIIGKTQDTINTAKDVISNKKPVLVEKPLSLSVSESKKIKSHLVKHDGKLLVGHLLLFHPAIVKIKSMIDEGVV